MQQLLLMQQSAPAAVKYVPVMHAVHAEAPAAKQQSDPSQSDICQAHIVRWVALLGLSGTRIEWDQSGRGDAGAALPCWFIGSHRFERLELAKWHITPAAVASEQTKHPDGVRWTLSTPQHHSLETGHHLLHSSRIQQGMRCRQKRLLHLQHRCSQQY